MCAGLCNDVVSHGAQVEQGEEDTQQLQSHRLAATFWFELLGAMFPMYRQVIVSSLQNHANQDVLSW